MAGVSTGCGTSAPYHRCPVEGGGAVPAPFHQARKPAYRLKIDFGPELGLKHSSAQITKYYDGKDLVGKLVLAVVNFPPRQIANFFSEVLTLGVILGEGDICLVHPDRDVPLGSAIR